MLMEVNYLMQDSEHDAVAECAYLEQSVCELCAAHQATLKSDSVEGVNGADVDSAISFGASVSPEDLDNDYTQSDDDTEDDDIEFDIETIKYTEDKDGDAYDRLNAWEEYEDPEF